MIDRRSAISLKSAIALGKIMAHHILIIDDDIELCELLSEYLSHENLTITLIHDGLEAIEHLKSQQQSNKDYDAIVLDFMLPGI